MNDNPSRVWFVGDSLDDMLSGKHAGCRTCLIRTEFNRDLVDTRARDDVIDMYVHTLSEFCQRIGIMK